MQLKNMKHEKIESNAPPHSLKDSNVSPKVETKGIGVHYLACNILGENMCVRVPKWGLGQVTSKSIIQMNMHKPNNELVSA
jgi:hypothetical protein